MCNKNIITTVDGLQFPEGIKSSHLSSPLGSHNHKVSNKVTTEALSIFHDFTMKKNILYTIQGGSLMGQYWNEKMIYWDDDIDIHVEEKFLRDIVSMWEQGEPVTTKMFPEKTYRLGTGKFFKTSKKVYLLDRPCLLCFGGGVETPEGWKPIKEPKRKILRINFKLSPLNEHEEVYSFNRTWKYDKDKKIPVYRWSGMDINIPQEYGGKIFDSWFTRKEVPWFRKTEDERDFPVTQFNGIDARVVARSRGEPWLDKMYGPFWRERKHEKLKTKKDKCEDSRFRKR
jgi:hypothetical protein